MVENLKQYITIRNLLFFFSLVAGWPCVFYLMGWLPHYQVNYIFLFVGVCLYSVFNSQEEIPNTIRKLLIVQIISWFLYSIFYFDSSYYTRILILLITFFIVKMQMSDRSESFPKVYNTWLLIQVVLGSIGMLMVLAGVLKPLFLFREMDMRWGYCFGLFTTNTYLGGLIRNAGFYDEPGALAFWGMFALLLNKLTFDNRKYEIIMIIGLLSTLSVAYFIQIAAYLIVFYRRKSWKLVVFLCLIILVLKFISAYNDDMNKAIWGRMEYDTQTGTFKGDNRTELLERCWKIFCDNPILGVGARTMVSAEVWKAYGGFVGANFFFNFACDGLIGAIITYLPLIYLFKLGGINKGICIILILGYIQRPYDSTQLLFPLTMYTLLLYSYLGTLNSSFEEPNNNESIIQDR